MPKGIYERDPVVEAHRRELLRLAALKRWAERYEELKEKVSVVGLHAEKAAAARRKPVGTIKIDKEGYVYIKTSPGLWELEYHIVAETKLGRLLQKGEHVHHIDGNRLNNNPDNLEVLSISEHNKRHGVLKKHNESRKEWDEDKKRALYNKVANSNRITFESGNGKPRGRKPRKV